MKISMSAVMAVVISLLGMSTVYAAEAIDLSHLRSARMIALDPQSKIKEVSKSIDFNQTTHTRVYQTYEGYPVWGSEAVYHSIKGAAPNSMDGVFYRGLQADLSHAPAYIFNSDALTKALNQAKQYYADSVLVKFTASHASAKLIVYIDEHEIAHWAYEVSFTTSRIKGLPAKPVYILDAVTFAIYEHWNNLKTAAAIVAGGGIGGNERIGKVVYDGLLNNRPALSFTRDAATSYCSLENETVVIKDQRTGKTPVFRCDAPDSKHNNVYWNTINDAANGGYSPNNDGVYSDKIVREMYMKWIGIPMLVKDGKPMRVTFYVHDPEQGQNAYYNDGEMVFGEGDEESYPVVAPSVVAHEMSHGFTEQHSDLMYRGQSGGINEAFSDMADKSVEYYMYGKNNWNIDAELLKDGGRMLRYMDEPTKDCAPGKKPGDNCSISHVKDYRSDTDVHHSSGIYNKAFVLMAKQWSTKEAFQVMVQANLSYWTPSTTFARAACGVIKAARDYKLDPAVVKSAMNQVGVDTRKCS